LTSAYTVIPTNYNLSGSKLNVRECDLGSLNFYEMTGKQKQISVHNNIHLYKRWVLQFVYNKNTKLLINCSSLPGFHTKNYKAIIFLQRSPCLRSYTKNLQRLLPTCRIHNWQFIFIHKKIIYLSLVVKWAT